MIKMLDKNILAAKLAETEKFGITDKNKLILDLIDNKIPHLKTKILALRDVMIENSGFVDSQKYDNALLKVLDEVKKVHDSINILDKPADIAAKEVDDIIKLS